MDNTLGPMDFVHQLEDRIAAINRLMEPLVREKRALDAALWAFGLVVCPEEAELSQADVAGLTHRQVLCLIAKRCGGRITTSGATRTMTQAGILRNPKTARQMVDAALRNSPEFIKSGRGQYRLEKEPAP